MEDLIEEAIQNYINYEHIYSGTDKDKLTELDLEQLANHIADYIK